MKNKKATGGNHAANESQGKDSKNVEYNVLEEPIVLSKSVIDLFLSANKDRGELIALYVFYYYTAKWQQTNQAKATISYVMKGLGWGRDKVRRVKQELLKTGLITDVVKRDNNNRVTGHYIKIKFIWGKGKTEQFHPPNIPPGGNRHGWQNQPPNALSTNSKNALSTNSKNSESLNFDLTDIKKDVNSNFKNFILDIKQDVSDHDEAGHLSDDHKKQRANLLLKEMLESQQKIERLQLIHKKSESEIKHAIKKFSDQQYAADDVSRNFKKYWKHFAYWYNTHK
ncbi:MAG: hypothetical protein U5L09_09840 [Bacteroidales bacterium]|nr:hypothetical protein [Bacteroidales bacterium]